MFNRFECRKGKRKVFAKCNYTKESIPVQSNLVLTPAQMYGMSLQGKPISSFMLPDDNFDDGRPYEADDFFVPFDEKRGVDVNDLYQYQKELETKVKDYRKRRVNNVEKV